MVKQILTYPENKEILTSKSVVVENIEDVKDLIQDLKDTLHSTKSGCGISAVQIGELKRVCIISHNGQDTVMINPVITRRRPEKVFFREGCLSAPNVYNIIERDKKVWVEYLDENGNKKIADQGGLFSIIVQHELDHFEGWCEVFNQLKEEEEKVGENQCE